MAVAQNKSVFASVDGLQADSRVRKTVVLGSDHGEIKHGIYYYSWQQGGADGMEGTLILLRLGGGHFTDGHFSFIASRMVIFLSSHRVALLSQRKTRPEARPPCNWQQGGADGRMNLSMRHIKKGERGPRSSQWRRLVGGGGRDAEMTAAAAAAMTAAVGGGGRGRGTWRRRWQRQQHGRG